MGRGSRTAKRSSKKPLWMPPLHVTESHMRAEPLAFQEMQARPADNSRLNGSARLDASVRCKGSAHRRFQESLVAVREPRPTSLLVAPHP